MEMNPRTKVNLDVTPRGSQFTAVLIGRFGGNGKYEEIVERMTVTASKEKSFQLAGEYWFSRKTGKRLKGIGYIRGY